MLEIYPEDSRGNPEPQTPAFLSDDRFPQINYINRGEGFFATIFVSIVLGACAWGGLSMYEGIQKENARVQAENKIARQVDEVLARRGNVECTHPVTGKTSQLAPTRDRDTVNSALHTAGCVFVQKKWTARVRA